MFIVLFNFSVSWATIWPTFIDMNPLELKYYSFMISLSKCSESFNTLSQKICVPKET